MTKTANQKRLAKIKKMQVAQKKFQLANKCPTPDKVPFESENIATKRAQLATYNLGKIHKTYLCSCGCWHLTTQK